MVVASPGWSVDQTSYRLVFEALRESVWVGPDTGEGLDLVRYRASVVLYLLLLDHPINRWGRCRSCPGVLPTLLWPRACQIYLSASEWLLHHPDEALLRSRLERGLKAGSVLTAGVAGPRQRSGLTVQARTAPGKSDLLPSAADHSPTDLAPTPALPPPPPPGAGGPDPTLSGARDDPEDPRFGRVPPPDNPSPGDSLAITGGLPWPR